MENIYTSENGQAERKAKDQVDADIIKVRAILQCPSCGYRRVFSHTFKRENIELLTVSLKIFDFVTCNECGSLIDLSLEYEI